MPPRCHSARPVTRVQDFRQRPGARLAGVHQPDYSHGTMGDRYPPGFAAFATTSAKICGVAAQPVLVDKSSGLFGKIGLRTDVGIGCSLLPRLQCNTDQPIPAPILIRRTAKACNRVDPRGDHRSEAGLFCMIADLARSDGRVTKGDRLDSAKYRLADHRDCGLSPRRTHGVKEQKDTRISGQMDRRTVHHYRVLQTRIHGSLLRPVGSFSSDQCSYSCLFPRYANGLRDPKGRPGRSHKLPEMQEAHSRHSPTNVLLFDKTVSLSRVPGEDLSQGFLNTAADDGFDDGASNIPLERSLKGSLNERCATG